MNKNNDKILDVIEELESLFLVLDERKLWREIPTFVRNPLLKMEQKLMSEREKLMKAAKTIDTAGPNAALIALAPQMAEALAEAVAWIDRLKPSVALEVQRGASPLDWVNSARALLNRLSKGGA